MKNDVIIMVFFDRQEYPSSTGSNNRYRRIKRIKSKLTQNYQTQRFQTVDTLLDKGFTVSKTTNHYNLCPST